MVLGLTLHYVHVPIIMLFYLCSRSLLTFTAIYTARGVVARVLYIPWMNPDGAALVGDPAFNGRLVAPSEESPRRWRRLQRITRGCYSREEGSENTGPPESDYLEASAAGMWATKCKSYEGGEHGTGWPAGRARVAGTEETRCGSARDGHGLRKVGRMGEWRPTKHLISFSFKNSCFIPKSKIQTKFKFWFWISQSSKNLIEF
jgi:hypothetical protein